MSVVFRVQAPVLARLVLRPLVRDLRVQLLLVAWLRLSRTLMFFVAFFATWATLVTTYSTLRRGPVWLATSKDGLRAVRDEAGSSRVCVYVSVPVV